MSLHIVYISAFYMGMMYSINNSTQSSRTRVNQCSGPDDSLRTVLHVNIIGDNKICYTNNMGGSLYHTGAQLYSGYSHQCVLHVYDALHQ